MRLGQSLARAAYIWAHGLMVAMILGLSLLVAGIWAVVLLLPVSLLLEVMGRPEVSNFWFCFAWALTAPLGIGMAARKVDFDDLKPNGYR